MFDFDSNKVICLFQFLSWFIENYISMIDTIIHAKQSGDISGTDSSSTDDVNQAAIMRYDSV